MLVQYLNESGASIAMMEQNDQSLNLTWPGIEDLLDETGYHGVRVFNEWAYIQNRYQYCGYEGPEEITNTFFPRHCRAQLQDRLPQDDPGAGQRRELGR